MKHAIEHVHEWEWGHNLEFGSHIRRKDNVAIRMGDEEVLRRLNATERLRGKKAELYSCHIVEDPPFLIPECAADLRAYAAILESE